MISKERFAEILSKAVREVFADNPEFLFTDTDNALVDFAHALLKAVEAESAVVKTLVPNLADYKDSEAWINASNTKLIALPLVEGD